MESLFDMTLDFGIGGEDSYVQESASFNAGSAAFKDLFGDKFTSFQPDTILQGGVSNLKSGMFAMDIEDSNMAIDYSYKPPALDPAHIGRFADPLVTGNAL
jgi:hypothetical protein